jgi:hypothetical protein
MMSFNQALRGQSNPKPLNYLSQTSSDPHGWPFNEPSQRSEEYQKSLGVKTLLQTILKNVKGLQQMNLNGLSHNNSNKLS